MTLKNLSKVIFEEDTASENRKITVKDVRGIILWQGKAKDLSNYEKGSDWLVLEIVVDNEDDENAAYYNKGKIITVY